MPKKILGIWKMGCLTGQATLLSNSKYEIKMLTNVFKGPIDRFNTNLTITLTTFVPQSITVQIRLFSTTKDRGGLPQEIEYTSGEHSIQLKQNLYEGKTTTILSEDCLSYDSIILHVSIQQHPDRSIDNDASQSSTSTRYLSRISSKDLYYPLPITRLSFLSRSVCKDWSMFNSKWNSSSKRRDFVLATSDKFQLDNKIAVDVKELSHIFAGCCTGREEGREEQVVGVIYSGMDSILMMMKVYYNDRANTVSASVLYDGVRSEVVYDAFIHILLSIIYI